MSLYSFLMVQLKKIFGVTCGSHSHFHSLRTSHPKKIWPGTAKFRRHRILVSIFWRQMSLTQMTSQKRLRKLFIWPKVWIAFSANSIFVGACESFKSIFLCTLCSGVISASKQHPPRCIVYITFMLTSANQLSIII